MQVFIRYEQDNECINQTIPLEVQPTNTLRELIQLAYQKVNAHAPSPRDDQIVMHDRRQKRLNNFDLQLHEYNIQGQDELRLRITGSRSSERDMRVIEGLKLFFSNTAFAVGEKEFIFIGVASYDHGHHGNASIKLQQCPDSLFTYCRDHGIKLTIILIDYGFSSVAEGVHRQIYDLPGWQFEKAEMGRKIRHYKYPLPFGSIRLTTFSTAISEFTSDGIMNQGKIIEEVNIPVLFNAITYHSNACLVCGNFFVSAGEFGKSQFFTMGDASMLSAAGFTINPLR